MRLPRDAFPASDRPLVILGDARRRAGDTAGAIDAYTAALAIQPYNLAAALPLMDLERRTGQPDDARRVLRATDTSDATLLAWAWRRHAPPPTAALDLGSGFEFGSLINFYAPEGQAPTDFRWTNGHGLVRLTVPPGGAARLTVRLSGMRPRGAPPAGRVDILVDGRALATVAADGAWRTAVVGHGIWLWLTLCDDICGLHFNVVAWMAASHSGAVDPCRVRESTRSTRLIPPLSRGDSGSSQFTQCETEPGI